MTASQEETSPAWRTNQAGVRASVPLWSLLRAISKMAATPLSWLMFIEHLV